MDCVALAAGFEGYALRPNRRTLNVHQLCWQNAQRDIEARGEDEGLPNRRYEKRHADFLKYIQRFGRNSIMSFKELRVTPDADNVMRDPLHFLADYLTVPLPCLTGEQPFLPAKHTMALGGYANTKQYLTDGLPKYLPFHLAQIYDLNSFVVLDQQLFDFHEEVMGAKTSHPHWGCAILACLYETRERPGFRFIVESFHMPVSESHKTACALWIRDVYPSKRVARFGKSDSSRVIRTGDFNIFADKPESEDQADALEAGFIDVSYSMTDVATGKPIYSTFFPAPQDPFYPNRLSPFEKCDLSPRLDRIFCSEGFEYDAPCTGSRAWVLATPQTELENKGYLPISDHFPLFVEFEIGSAEDILED